MEFLYIGPQWEPWCHVCLTLHSSESVLLPLQRGPTTSSMPKPWMLFATGPSVSTSPPTLKVWAMATVWSLTARWVPVQLHYFCISYSVCLWLPVSTWNGSNTMSCWDDSENRIEERMHSSLFIIFRHFEMHSSFRWSALWKMLTRSLPLFI